MDRSGMSRRLWRGMARKVMFLCGKFRRLSHVAFRLGRVGFGWVSSGGCGPFNFVKTSSVELSRFS